MNDKPILSNSTATRRRVVERAENLGLLDLDLVAEPKRSRRLAEILEQLPDRVTAEIDSRLSDELALDSLLIEQFTENYGISPAEKKLLVALSAGQTVGQHAECLGISINTARTHVRRLLEKTGSQNQVDLIGKLMR